MTVVDVRQARDVGDALELGRAFGRRDRRVPRHAAGDDVHREQVAARGAGEETAARSRAAGRIANRQGRVRTLVHPFGLAVRDVEAVDAAVTGEHDRDLVGEPRWRDNFARYARCPRGFAVGVEREHFTLIGTDHDMRGVGAGTRGYLLADVDTPYDTPARRVDADERAVARRCIHDRLRDGWRESRRRLADVDLPIELRRDRRVQVRERTGLVALAEQPAERRRRNRWE